VLHIAGLRRERRKADPKPSLVDAARVVDRPRREGLVAVDDELRPVHLRLPFAHPDPIHQTRVMRRVRVTLIDRDLEVGEHPPLQLRVGELHHEPRSPFAVFADEAQTRPYLVVVEDLPQPVGVTRIAGPGTHREQLLAQGVVAQPRLSGHHGQDRPMGLLNNGLVRRLRPGIAVTLDSVEPFRAEWETSNASAIARSGPLWLALGDSTAQGIGAPAPDRGYVGQLRPLLEARDGRSWRVVNASRTGARLRDVITNQLGWLDRLPSPPNLVTCAVGANDVTWRPVLRRILRDLTTLLDRLPPGAVVATLPHGLGRSRAPVINEVIRAQAATRGLGVADVWARTGPPWAEKFAPDHFHPSERGYRDWTAAFAAALGLDESGSGAQRLDA
jgi:lysophospholipase L1-like esterase